MIPKRLLLIGFIPLLIFITSCSSQSENPLEINIKEHKQLALHIHIFLDIEILEEKQLIPTNIGITYNGMRIIHTHDSSGKLHIESIKPIPIYLKYFFTIWGKQFNKNCILDNCIEDGTSLTMFVNDLENKQYGDYVLQDGDRVKIVYN